MKNSPLQWMATTQNLTETLQNMHWKALGQKLRQNRPGRRFQSRFIVRPFDKNPGTETDGLKRTPKADAVVHCKHKFWKIGTSEPHVACNYI
jgi:hypothetical protein